MNYTAISAPVYAVLLHLMTLGSPGCSKPQKPMAEALFMGGILRVQLNGLHATKELIVEQEIDGAITLSGQVATTPGWTDSASTLFIEAINPRASTGGNSFEISLSATFSSPVVGEMLVTALRAPQDDSAYYISSPGRDFDDARVIYNHDWALDGNPDVTQVVTGTIECSSPVDCLNMWVSFPLGTPETTVDINTMRVYFIPPSTDDATATE